MSFRHFKLILKSSLGNIYTTKIISFRNHSIHSMVIRAVEWCGMTFCWDDRNEGRMMVLVIQRAFPSFLSFQISLKNCTFLDFIPVILASFRHSGVIPKFCINWNDVGMTNDFGLKLTTFPSAESNWVLGERERCTFKSYDNCSLALYCNDAIKQKAWH